MDHTLALRLPMPLPTPRPDRRETDAAAGARRAEQLISRSQHIEALGRLTGGVAHDFNNLLGVISNSAHLIRMHSSDPALHAPVSAALRAVEAGTRLTQHLLRLAGRAPQTCPQVLDLDRFLPGMEPLLKTVLGPRIEVSVWVAPESPSVEVDASELELALTNLALNARDAMRTGGHLRLQARLAVEDEVPDLPAGRYLLLTISDDGVGLPDDLAERVFEPFFTTKAMGQGTGLSLAQVMGFCVQAGGTARLTTTEGLGTTVSLLLPAAAIAPALVAPPEPAVAWPELPSIADARVLLVEDNLDLAEVTVSLLSSLGCRVQHARGPQEALRWIVTGSEFDVVLSDVMMGGGMSGVDLARELRRRRPALPVLLISGYTNSWSSTDDFVLLRKPCEPEQLVNALHDAIDGAAQGKP